MKIEYSAQCVSAGEKFKAEKYQFVCLVSSDEMGGVSLSNAII